MNELVFEIVKPIGKLVEYPTGWNKELNIVSWNGQPPKFDIRDWDSTHERMSRGITLTTDESAALCTLLTLQFAK